MKNIDEASIKSGVSGEVLMGRAATGLAEEISFLTDGQPRPVVVLAGPGNNGGDGYGLAFHLKRMGWPVEVWAAHSRDRVRGAAECYLHEAEEAGVRFRWMPEAKDWEQAERYRIPDALLVDALLGTGTADAPRKAVEAAVRFLICFRSRHRVIAVDVPTGLDVDTGKPYNSDGCVQADFTLTLAGAKLGFLNDASAGWTGSVSVVDLDISSELLEEKASSDWLTIGLRQARKLMPPRPPDTHKGSRGHVLGDRHGGAGGVAHRFRTRHGADA
jgi:NAD(P)H-hydrate epimerase